MLRIFYLIIITLLLTGWKHGSGSAPPPPPPPPPGGNPITLNFSGQSYSGCASLAACINVSRASNETCTNLSGVITYVTPNTGCINDAGLAIWPAATNVLLDSGNQVSGNWGGFASGSGSKTINSQSAGSAPDGVGTASQVTIQRTNGAFGDAAFLGQNVTATGTWTGSCYINASGANVGKEISIGLFNGDGTQGGYANYILTSTWTLVSFTAKTNTSATFQFDIGYMGQSNNPQSGTTVFSIWGCQVEASNSAIGNIPTPYIPTTSIAVTRSADVVTLVGTAASTVNAAAASIVVGTTAGTTSGTTKTLIDSNGTALLQATSSNTLTNTVGSITTTSTANWIGSNAAGGTSWSAAAGVSIVLNNQMRI
jgi:hypothetical protein